MTKRELRKGWDSGYFPPAKSTFGFHMIPVSIFDAHVLPFRRIDETKRQRLEQKLRELNQDA